MAQGTETKKQILLVDDDLTFLETVSQLFMLWSNETWQVHSSNTVAFALGMLEQYPIDLAVMDIQMPVVDGIQFLRILNHKYPNLRKVVLTGFPSEEHRVACLNSGAELFLEKPRSREGFETLFATLSELAAWQPQEGFHGMLRQVGLHDVLQMECIGRKSSLLEIGNAQMRGRIYIERGAIVHALAGEVKGVPAVNQLLCLSGGEFSLKPYEDPPERTIEGQWEFLLMEAARMRDEQAHQANEQTAALADATQTVPLQPAPPQPPPQAALAGGAAAASAREPVLAELPATERRIDEVVVCAGRGEVLYEWQCKDIDTRVKLFHFVAQKAGQLNRIFSLGRFDRLEILGPYGRIVAQIAPDRQLFVCSSQVQPEAST